MIQSTSYQRRTWFPGLTKRPNTTRSQPYDEDEWIDINDWTGELPKRRTPPIAFTPAPCSDSRWGDDDFFSVSRPVSPRNPDGDKENWLSLQTAKPISLTQQKTSAGQSDSESTWTESEEDQTDPIDYWDTLTLELKMLKLEYPDELVRCTRTLPKIGIYFAHWLVIAVEESIEFHLSRYDLDEALENIVTSLKLTALWTFYWNAAR